MMGLSIACAMALQFEPLGKSCQAIEYVNVEGLPNMSTLPPAKGQWKVRGLQSEFGASKETRETGRTTKHCLHSRNNAKAV